MWVGGFWVPILLLALLGVGCKFQEGVESWAEFRTPSVQVCPDNGPFDLQPNDPYKEIRDLFEAEFANFICRTKPSDPACVRTEIPLRFTKPGQSFSDERIWVMDDAGVLSPAILRYRNQVLAYYAQNPDTDRYEEHTPWVRIPQATVEFFNKVFGSVDFPVPAQVFRKSPEDLRQAGFDMGDEGHGTLILASLADHNPLHSFILSETPEYPSRLLCRNSRDEQTFGDITDSMIQAALQWKVKWINLSTGYSLVDIRNDWRHRCGTRSKPNEAFLKWSQEQWIRAFERLTEEAGVYLVYAAIPRSQYPSSFYEALPSSKDQEDWKFDCIRMKRRFRIGAMSEDDRGKERVRARCADILILDSPHTLKSLTSDGISTQVPPLSTSLAAPLGLSYLLERNREKGNLFDIWDHIRRNSAPWMIIDIKSELFENDRILQKSRLAGDLLSLSD